MDLFKMSFCPVFGFAALLRSALLNTKLDRQPRDTLIPHHDMWWEEAKNACIVQDTKQALHSVVKQSTENIKFGVWGTPAQQHKHCDNAEWVLGKNFQSDLIIPCHFPPRSKCSGKCFVFYFPTENVKTEKYILVFTDLHSFSEGSDRDGNSTALTPRTCLTCRSVMQSNRVVAAVAWQFGLSHRSVRWLKGGH